MPDHRQDYTVMKLFVNGQRMVDDYSKDDAVADYVALHPDANPKDVRGELEREIAKAAA